MNPKDTGRSSHDSVVLPPSLPDTKELLPSDYIFNSVGFYTALQDRVDDQRAQILEIFTRLQRQGRPET